MIKIYTDGSCLGNPGNGGWAAIIIEDEITEWIHKWKKNGWKTANKQPVKNKELWNELDNLTKKFEIKWSWVKGHSTDTLNNEVDLIARQAAKF